ncbi:UNVERIFIED_CONTAM: hypothetical protein Sradi_4660000 [Sesamum radiatum]|uniref:Uncharacterized protein n=1 Tax=Sesamum radiatum TaxID=300843 RepID=A0AAW2MWS1_SESRA
MAQGASPVPFSENGAGALSWRWKGDCHGGGGGGGAGLCHGFVTCCLARLCKRQFFDAVVAEGS